MRLSRRRRFPAGAASIALAFAALQLITTGRALAAPPAKQGDTVGLTVIPMERGGLNRLLIPMVIEGKKGTIMLDTGAASTLLDSAKYRFLLPGPGRQLPAGIPATVIVNGRPMKVGLARDVQIGTVKLGLLAMVVGPAGVLGGDARLPGGAAAAHFDGVLGEDILRHFRAVVDCARSALYLTNPGSKINAGPKLVAAGWTRVPMSDLNNNFTVVCRLGQHPYRLIVDTGAPFTALDGGIVDREQIKTHDLPIFGGFIGARHKRAQFVESRSLVIGNYLASDIEMVSQHGLVGSLNTRFEGTPPLLGVLGSDLLARHNAIIDIGNHSLYLKPNTPGGKKP